METIHHIPADAVGIISMSSKVDQSNSVSTING